MEAMRSALHGSGYVCELIKEETVRVRRRVCLAWARSYQVEFYPASGPLAVVIETIINRGVDVHASHGVIVRN